MSQYSTKMKKIIRVENIKPLLKNCNQSRGLEVMLNGENTIRLTISEGKSV